MSSSNYRYARILLAALPILVAIPILFMLPPVRQPELVGPEMPAAPETPAPVVPIKAPQPALEVNEELGVRHAPGFKLTLYSNHDLANDIYSMTLDKQGRVVVSSQGWIKILHDDNRDNKADRATVFARCGSGSMGLNFDGNDLLCMADGQLLRYRDADGNGEADGQPEKLFPISFGEHGGHNMRKGPDGCWYMISGNDARIDKRHVTTPDSPIQAPETGCVTRLTPDCKQSEVIAQGFRNPYRFDFNAAGEMFTYDSDVESDYFLPYYSYTRLYHIAHGAHHGWRMTGWKRSYCRPDYYLDTVNILSNVGRGSPTGVMGYRHAHFPAHYRGGIFAQDWTSGKIYFCKLEPDGATYKTTPEIFIEPTGSEGFAPTDMVVRPDGRVYVSIGGRKTRGAVFLVEYTKNPPPVPAPLPPLDQVLQAHQPLEAWSREQWVPMAQKLGAQAFAAAATDTVHQTPATRVRAIEVLTELFGGVPGETAATIATKPSLDVQVRARLAWSLSRAPKDNWQETLLALAQDQAIRRGELVRAAALNALLDRVNQCDPAKVAAVLPENMSYTDRRVQLAATLLAAKLPEAGWQTLAAMRNAAPRGALQYALALAWRSPADAPQSAVIDIAAAVLEKSQDAGERLSAIRLIMLALGDWNLAKPPVEVHTAYSLPLAPPPEQAARVLAAVRVFFPSKNEELDAEAGRLIAMFEDGDPSLPAKVASFWSDKSSPTSDFHYLAVMSRLKAPLSAELAPVVAKTIVGLNQKLEGLGGRNKQNWIPRLNELVTKLSAQNPLVASEMLTQPRFVAPGHVDLVANLPADLRSRAAILFFSAVKNDDKFPWSSNLVTLLSSVPQAEFLPVLRKQWSNFALRDRIVHHLASHPPQEEDRRKFLTGLEAPQQDIVQMCINALTALPADPTPKHLVPAFKLLRKYTFEPGQRKMRAALTALIAKQYGREIAIKEEKTDPASLRAAYQPLFDEFLKANPALAEDLSDGEDPAYWAKLLKEVPWEKGETAKGEALFRDRACMTCHAIAGALGPNLNGAANRFSKEDLFDQIIYPSRNVADNFRTTSVRLMNGNSYTGMIAFGAADTLLMLTGATTTVRINTAEIAEQRPSNLSLMPNNLLRDLKPEDLAHLYAYLRSLK